MAAYSELFGEAPQKINVRQFLEQWGQSIDYSCISKDDVAASIAKRMKVSKEVVKELSEVCSPAALWATDEMTDRQAIFDINPPHVDLETVKYQMAELAKRRESPAYTNLVRKKMKYNNMGNSKLFKKAQDGENEVNLVKKEEVATPNVVLTIDVHKPFHNKPQYKMTISETYQVLGTNHLTEFRDLIRCANDYAVGGDLSLTPDLTHFTYAKDIFKSGFIFVEDTFYSDMRHPDNRDYSQNIHTWVSQNERYTRVGPFKSAKMEDATFLDLDLVVGKPYFYQHQGDCEHILIFSDVRMMHPQDLTDRQTFPKLTREINLRRKICMACSINTAGWMVYNSSLVPTNPSFMCHRCFKALLYDANGQKIGNFEAYKSSEHPQL